MNQGKNVSIPTSVEAQVRTRARNLPIYKCYINDDWEKRQKAFVIVTRKHTNGNITMGNFLVDLKLPGVKDCTYHFNESPLRLDEILKSERESLVECDYNLAHNVIFAGLEFAEDFGFAPHKNFKTAQYILEEDTDDIPLMEVPLGEDGVPVLIVPYGETGAREMSILNKTADGDYRVVFLDKTGKPEQPERTYMEILDDIVKTGIDEYTEKHASSKSPRETQVMIDLMHLLRTYSEEEKIQIDTAFRVIAEDPRITMEYDEPVKDYEKELALPIQYFIEGKSDEASVGFRQVIDKYPDDPLLWDIYLYDLSLESDVVNEEAVKEAYSRFPNHPFIKAWYAEWLAQEEKFDEVFALFGNIPGLDALTTDNTFISQGAITSFCFAYTAAWLQKGDVWHAEPYYQVIVRLGLDYRIGKYIQQTMTLLKKKKLEESFDEENEE